MRAAAERVNPVNQRSPHSVRNVTSIRQKHMHWERLLRLGVNYVVGIMSRVLWEEPTEGGVDWGGILAPKPSHVNEIRMERSRELYCSAKRVRATLLNHSWRKPGEWKTE